MSDRPNDDEIPPFPPSAAAVPDDADAPDAAAPMDPTPAFPAFPAEAPTMAYPVSGSDAPTVSFVSAAAPPSATPPAAAPPPGGPFPGGPVPGGPVPGGPVPPPKRSQRWIWILVVIAVLVIAVIVLTVTLVTRGGVPGPVATPTASASPTPSSTPSPTPTGSSSPTAGPTTAPQPEPTTDPEPQPQPEPAAPVITSFAVSPTSVTCSVPDPALPGTGLTSTPITITWSSTGAIKGWIGVDTTDAQAEPYQEVNAASGTLTIDFACYGDHTYTLTVVSNDGTATSETRAVVNNGDKP